MNRDAQILGMTNCQGEVDWGSVEERQPQTSTKQEMQQAMQNYNARRQRFDVGPSSDQLLSPFTVFCLIMNRTIASGIFTQPVNILLYSDSSGVSILLWVVAGIIVTSLVQSWLELALTVPFHDVFRNGEWVRISTPRSGGDKNYLEYIYGTPKFLMTCIFGMVFIIFGNLSGNAIQFGVYLTLAIHTECQADVTGACVEHRKAEVLGWAVAVVTLCALINISTRRLSILLNNILATLKVLFVFLLAVIGLIWGSVHGDGCRQITWHKWGSGGRFGDIVLALFYAMYPYTGYEQPFYVLAEVSRPQRTFAKATNVAMGTVVLLYPLVNVSFLCMSPYNGPDSLPNNMVLAFMDKMSGDSTAGPSIAAPVIIAVFIFGNLLAQTYTASRVKQEIAKEGILPWSLFFATSTPTLLGRVTSSSSDLLRGIADSNFESRVEFVPMAATFLHWIVEVVLVLAVGIPTDLVQAYNVLTYVYTFSVVALLGFLTTAGLAYLKLDSLLFGAGGWNWMNLSAWRPWFDPLPTVVAAASLGFLLFASFVPPTVNISGDEKWYMVGPTVGIFSAVLGLLWWLGLQYVQWRCRWELHVTRIPLIDMNTGVQMVEKVEHDKVPVIRD